MKPIKGTSLRGKTSFCDALLMKIDPSVLPVRVTKRPKKKDKEILNIANWVFVQATHVVRSKSNSAWGIVFGGGGSSKFQISSK